jgi:peptidoglycan/LPS O-acetylase OafA/YrhL
LKLETESTPAESGPIASPVGDPRRSSFRPDVEGLRAIAVLAVVLYHANIPFITGGYVGVDVFFVISGFLITGILISERERTQAISISGFYARRVRRVLPAASLVIVLTVVFGYLLVGVARAQGVADDSYWVALFLGNYHFAEAGINYFNRGAPASPLLHYWSLAVEEQFYIAWPITLILTGLAFKRFSYRFKLGVVLSIAIVGSLIWSILQTSQDPNWAYFSPFTRAWELGIGAALAIAVPTIRKAPRSTMIALSWAGLIAIVVATFVYTPSTPFPGYAALLPTLGAAAVIVGGTVPDSRGAVALLGLRPVRFLGRISYSLYLWHWPILVLAAGYAGHSLSTGVNLLLLVGAGILSTISYFLVEEPVRTSQALRTRSNYLSIGLGLVLIATVLAVAALEIHTHQVIYKPPSNLSNPVFP